jgi:endogenous inhibitor of DNA gyrase (YacG/DUF329 family)
MFCSRQCGDKWLRQHPNGEPRICKHCGKEYIPKATDRIKYCSRECAFADKAKKCKTCGKTIASNQSDYCSEECKQAPVLKVCRECGKEFMGHKTSGLCSDDCRRAEKRRIHKEKYFVSVKETNPMIKKKCKHCGKEFTTNFMANSREFCSEKCSKKNGKRQRRARKKKQFIEEVSLAYIYERDGGRCKICGKKVDIKKLAPHPKSATLDHIIPLAEGGLHEKKNVQLAHFICNSRKGTGGTDQLRLFG